MLQYGGFWRRVGAYLIDAILAQVVLTVIGSLFAAANLALGGYGGPDGLYLIGLIGGWLYFALMESSAAQATVGKMVLGVTVVDLGGRRIGFLRATGRYFAKFLSVLVFMVGFMMVGWTARKRGLHDMLAGTLVVKAGPGAAIDVADAFR